MPSKPIFETRAPYKCHLSEIMVQRLGFDGKAAEVLKLAVNEGLEDQAIMERLELDAPTYSAIVNQHLFARELKAQLNLKRRYDRAYAQKQLQNLPKKAKPKSQDVLPPVVVNVQLPKGMSPAEYAVKRIGQTTPEAVEKLVWLMHNSKLDNIQYNAATKLLGLAGIVEVEKSISVIADAEAIIRELNRRGPYKPKPDAIDAEIVGSSEIVGDSTTPSPTNSEEVRAFGEDNGINTSGISTTEDSNT